MTDPHSVAHERTHERAHERTHERAGIGVRWTIGDVSERGFEALRLSVWGARKVFGAGAGYVICVNSIPVEAAQGQAGPLPEEVVWRDVSGEMAGLLAGHFGPRKAEGVGWKFAPLRVFPERCEISLDNDCILWELPGSMEAWLAGVGKEPQRCLMAQDVRRCFGQFSEQCGPQALNSGIRGVPPGYDLEAALRRVLNRPHGERVVLTSELDEQGMQAAALSRGSAPAVVRLEEVTICSPFWPLQPQLGRCGAHFVGLNGRHIPWDYFDRPADAWMAEHWEGHRAELYRRVGLRMPAESELPAGRSRLCAQR